MFIIDLTQVGVSEIKLLIVSISRIVWKNFLGFEFFSSTAENFSREFPY